MPSPAAQPLNDRLEFALEIARAAGDVTLHYFLRPDLVVRIPGGKQVVVDAKVPLAAYLEAFETSDESERGAQLAAHARQVREHASKLAAKAYWRQFAPTPDFVVMFVPDETLLRVAHEHDRRLAEDAWAQGVVLASPSTLMTVVCAASRPRPPMETPSAMAAIRPRAASWASARCAAAKSSLPSRMPRALCQPMSTSSCMVRRW